MFQSISSCMASKYLYYSAQVVWTVLITFHGVFFTCQAPYLWYWNMWPVKRINFWVNYPFKELDRELFGVCVCLNFLVWPWLWVFNMSGFLLPLGKDGAIVNYSLNWQVDWICGMDDEMLLKYSFFLCAADGLGHPPTCPGTASREVELWIHHLTAVPQRKRVPFNWCISWWTNRYWSCSSEWNEKKQRERTFPVQ